MTERATGGPVSGEILGVVGHRAAPLDDAEAAKVQLRNAVQWLARVANSYAGAPDGRLQLRFDADARRLSTPELAPETRLTLQLPDLVFQFYERGVATKHPLDVDDKSSTEIEAWLLAELLHRGFDRDRFTKELPYAWDGQMSGDEAKYSPHRLSDSLRTLTRDLVEAAVASQARKGDTAGHASTSDVPFRPDRCRVEPATSHG